MIMESKYIFEKSSLGTSVGVADFTSRAGRSVLFDSRIPVAVEKNSSVMPAYTQQAPVFYKLVMDGGSTAEVQSEGTPSSSQGNGRIFRDVEKVSVKNKTKTALLYKLSKPHARSSDHMKSETFHDPSLCLVCVLLLVTVRRTLKAFLLQIMKYKLMF